MPIQRSWKVNSEVRPGKCIFGRNAAKCPFFLWQHSSLLGLLVLTLLLSGCDALPARPRLSDLPFLQPGRESSETVPNLRLFLPEEGAVTEALRGRISSWAAANELQVDLYTAANYGQELPDRLAGEEAPDLVVVTGFLFPDLAAEGLLAPAAEGVLDPTGYPSQLAAAFTWPPEDVLGLRYCLPREVRTLALVYDKEGLDGAGLAPPTNWESIRAVAADQTDLDSNRFGFIESPDLSRWLPFLYGAGGSIVDENGSMALQTQSAATALDWYIQIFRDNFAGHAGESNNEWSGEVLGKGKGAMSIEGNWVAPYFDVEFPAFHYGVAPLPAGPAKLNNSVAFTSCYAVSADSPRQDDAFELAVYLNSPEVVGSLPNDGGWMPAQTALRDAWKQDFPQLAAFADAVPSARVWQLPVGFEDFLHSFNRRMVQLFAAQVEGADFLAEMQQLGDSLLEAPNDKEPDANTTPNSSP